MPELVICRTDGSIRSHAFTGTVVLGRDASCEVLLDDLGTSRRHARIRPEGDEYVIEDLGSKNGTLLNGVSCQTAALTDGDEILLGAARVVFRGPQATRPSPGWSSSADGSTGGLTQRRSAAGESVILIDRTPPKSTRYSRRAERLVLPQRRLELLYELSERLTRLRDRNKLLNDVLDICFETLQFERGAIGLRRMDGPALDWPVVRNLRSSSGELTVSRSVLKRALEQGERAVFTDADPATDPTMSIVQLGIRSALCVPLAHHDEILGVIYGDRTSTGAVYTEEDLDFLAGLARQVSIGLINTRLAQEQQARLQLEHEIGLARQIQQRLFPEVLPDRANLRVSAVNLPGRYVSGDYYDVLELADGRVAFVIADVTGEGVAAAMLMANLQAAVRVTAPAEDDPGALLTQWNRLIFQNTEVSRFVTCMVGVVDPARRVVRLASAGHPPPLFRHGAGTAWTEMDVEGGYPLGIQADVAYTTQRLELGERDCAMFCYTDGVIEAMNATQELWTRDRLVASLEGTSDNEPGGIIIEVRKQIAAFCREAAQSDDITMLALQLPP